MNSKIELNIVNNFNSLMKDLEKAKLLEHDNTDNLVSVHDIAFSYMDFILKGKIKY